MAMDQRRRQKKIEKRRAKEKEKRRELARHDAGGMPALLRRTATAPILHCCVTSSIDEVGIGNMLVSRQLPDGRVAFAIFLLDIYCLGVKDAWADVLPRANYDARLYQRFVEKDPLRQLAPEYARKWLESAVQYAADLGLSPHPDYRTAKLIFGDISADACDERFVFGHKGKPYFMAGPHDSMEKSYAILSILENRCGPDGFYYVLPAGAFGDFDGL